MPLIQRLIAAAMIIAAATSCEDIDNRRLPPASVNIVFTTIGEWNIYGVAGPGQSNIFIKDMRLPSGYFYKVSEATGFGGVLLLRDPIGQYLAYDLACPVECKANIRVEWETGTGHAGILICPTCGSRYDAYSYGTPVAGPALDYKYGLERYTVSVGNTMQPYALVRR